MSEVKRALFAGSFDPVTIGHEEIIRRALPLFDELIVAIGINSSKRYFFSEAQRLELLAQTFADEPRIRVSQFDGLAIDFAKEQQAQFLLRGLRNGHDLDYEHQIELINKHMAPDLEVVYLVSSPNTAPISSTIVREVMKYQGKYRGLIPEATLELVDRFLAEKR